jgi:hypothetical protein
VNLPTHTSIESCPGAMLDIHPYPTSIAGYLLALGR